MRWRYFVRNRIQVRYFTLLLVSMTLPSILVVIYFYYLIFSLEGQRLVSSETITQGLFTAINKINPFVIVGLPAIFVLLFIWGILLSHRFAGPIDRLMRELNEIAEKADFSRRLKVRKNDELKPMVDCINNVLEKAERKTAV